MPEPRDDLQMMHSPMQWPLYGVLPMKTGSPKWENGLLLWLRGHYIWIPGANLFERVEANDPRAVVDPDLEQLVADGWRVD